MKKRVIVALVAGLILASIFEGVASAHVHGITPLRGLTCDNPISGALAVNDTPASATTTNGGPIFGLIPRDVGEAPLTGGDGGFGATTGNCP
ncbi:MAG: hypothetical protein HY682_05610 [Chloroflexi bacterium]|nr:hypothetical protein [Chloroflexota bacterium]